MILDFNELFKVDACVSSCSNSMINTTGVLENIEDMKKTDILAKHGNEIKYYSTDKESYYYFRIPDKTIESGAFRRKRTTREKIESALCEYYLNKEKEQLKSLQDDNMTLEQLFYEFMEHKKEKVSAGTIRRMVYDWKRYYKTNTDFIQKPYKDITSIDVDDFLNNIVNTTEIKDKAFCNMCGILKQTFEYAVSARYISANENPYRVEVNKKNIIRTRKKSSKEEVYNEHEKQLLFDELNRRLQNNPTNTNILAIMLEFELGTRRGEILAIKNSDVQNGKIHIHRQVIVDCDISTISNPKITGWHAVEYTKSDAGDRYIPLTQKAQEYIKQIQEINKKTGECYQDFLFVQNGYLVNPNKLYNLLRDICKRCINIPLKGTHRIRKTWISTLASQDIPLSVVSKISGHADEKTTMKYYVFNTNSEEETKKSILSALGDNTTSSNEELKNVTNRDNNIILFPNNKKAENPCYKRTFH